MRDGRALIASKGLADRARFEHGDAFDRASLAAIDPPPTLAVVSGLYELFADNDARRALARRARRRHRSPAATSSTPTSPGIRSSS